MEKTTIEQEEKRLQELSLTPKSKMTEEERREYNKLHNRKSLRKANTTEGWKKLLERGACRNTGTVLAIKPSRRKSETTR